MDDPIVLRYIGDRDGNEHYLVGYPKTDITQSQLLTMSIAAGKSPGELQTYLLSHSNMWELPSQPEPVTEEATSPFFDPFREESEQTPGEAAPAQRRRRES